MIPVPAAWLDTASSNHAPGWRAAILAADGRELQSDLPITAGQITRSETATPRVAADVDLPADAQPALLNQDYLPTGTRLRIDYRVNRGGWVTMCDLDITATALARPQDTWTIAAQDRSARIAADDLVRTAVPALGGMTVADAVRDLLIQRTFPADFVDASGPATTQTVPAKYGGDFAEGSPWALATALCAEARSEVFYKVDRRAQIRLIPTIGAPVDTLSVGAAGNVSAYVVRHEMAVNHVTLRYINANSGQLLRVGEYTDTRPTSPSAYQRIGSHIVAGALLEAESAPTQSQADAAAAQLLTRRGRVRSVELSHPPRPWLEPGDTVTVAFLGGPTEEQVVESVGIDLSHGATQVTRLRNHDYQMSEEVP